MNKSSTQTSSSDQEKSVVDQAKQAVGHVASDVANQAREQIDAQFEARREKAVDTIGDIASALRGTGEKLKGVGPLGDVAGRAADGMDKVSDFFDGKQIGDVVRDVERFARREPALFVGAAFALGIIGGRFLKSSAHRGGEASSLEGDYGPSTYRDSRNTYEYGSSGGRASGGASYGSSAGSYGSARDPEVIRVSSPKVSAAGRGSSTGSGYASSSVGGAGSTGGGSTSAGSTSGGSATGGPSTSGGSATSGSTGGSATSGSTGGGATGGSSSGAGTSGATYGNGGSSSTSTSASTGGGSGTTRGSGTGGSGSTGSGGAGSV
ncbi:MAG: hypothetical protein JWP97_686 [Labilithrix sp.]|nr:hypothetical protein [Labilithrix sp.]